MILSSTDSAWRVRRDGDLLGAGLVHQVEDGCVLATRARMRLVEVIGGTINV